MSQNSCQPPALVIEYCDSTENFRGWFVRHTMDHRICAGGMRVQAGLTRQHLIDMARNMSRKMQIAAIRVDGAKCGIDYDPAAPGKKAAMQRFMQAIKPYVSDQYSMGPDLNVEMTTLEEIASAIGLASVKMAIAGAQGWDIDYFRKRSEILQHTLPDGWTLSRLRAGYGVAMAALATLDYLQQPYDTASIAIQGFGTLAKAAAYTLLKKGVTITALADAEKCYVFEPALNVNDISLFAREETLLPRDLTLVHASHAKEKILAVDCDLLIPAAVENSIGAEHINLLQCKAIVPGANLAVADEIQELLHRRNILCLPDFLAGGGGSLSMAGLYGPEHHPTVGEVLHHIESVMKTNTAKVISLARKADITPTAAALELCGTVGLPTHQKPYGNIEGTTHTLLQARS